MSGPLSHIKVLDLSRVLAAPWAGQNLADLGAEVIKVERPGKGDDSRAYAPPYLQGRARQGDARIGVFLRGEPRQEVDHRQSLQAGRPAARARAREAVRRADRELQGRRSRALRPRLRRPEEAINPGLIYCSVTGFGQTGPVHGPPRLRLHGAGHGRADEHHRRARRSARAADRSASACPSST